MNKCIDCGAAIPSTGTRGRPPKRCPACKSTRPASGKCPTCGERFPISIKAGPVPVFCSRLCGLRNAKPLWTPTPKICPWCENEFLPNAPQSTYCSKKCAYDMRARERAGWPYVKECAYCAAPFILDPLARKQLVRKYCGMTCASASAKARRRAKIEGQENEDIDRSVVYNRDKWICGLCDQQVCRTLEWPDPMSKSLDHIIPIFWGGTHTYDNVQLAHLCCNLRASAKREEYENAT